MSVVKSEVWQAHVHQEWVKTVLITLIVQEQQKVAQFNCSDLPDLGKWMRASVSRLCCIDPAEEKLRRGKKRLQERGGTFATSFVAGSACAALTSTDALRYDHVCCFQGLDEECDSLAKMQQLFLNAAALLKPGGYFFGIVADSSELWKVAQKGKRGTDKLFQLQFLDTNFQLTGSEYTLHVDRKTHHRYLINIPTFCKAAAEADFEVTSFQNCLSFYEDYRKKFSEGLRALQVDGKVSLRDDQSKLVGLYTTFCFRKSTSRT
eukprot:TRINITY_DN456_c0_g1_i1.p1 TRINITY_DN456_c0_g1~~TRINITY_DN456_c0_g1_i1.p1  ORF type:complete len:263 (-),score=42.75 TRINITY_DN456_c0_g1_i1:1145-1933(-)